MNEGRLDQMDKKAKDFDKVIWERKHPDDAIYKRMAKQYADEINRQIINNVYKNMYPGDMVHVCR